MVGGLEILSAVDSRKVSFGVLRVLFFLSIMSWELGRK